MGTFKITTTDGVEHEVQAEASLVQAPGVLVLVTRDEAVALFPLANVNKVLIPETLVIAPKLGELKLLPGGAA